MRTISIQQALREVKLGENRVRSALSGAQFIAAGEKGVKTIGGQLVSDWTKNAKATYQQVQDLIANYTEIKQKVAESNATTTVEIAGQTFTVSAAIEKKNSIVLEQTLLNTLKGQLARVEAEAQRWEKTITAKADEVAAAMFSKDGKPVKSDEYQDFVKKFVEERQMTMIDPISIREEIKRLETFIEDFLAEVDYKLTESNVVTKISLKD